MLVGGCIRDSILEIPLQDLDIEVYGLSLDTLKNILDKRFPIDLIGQAFAVFKIHDLDVDISIPRRDIKTGPGHRSFEIDADPSLAPAEAGFRRDFTINAIAYDPITGELFDFYGGVNDLKRKILRHVSERFVEDPLRVLRGMQFAARFDLDAAPETISLCRTIESEGISTERIFEEWKKLLLKGIRISKGLEFLRNTGWVRYYPELEALIDCPQEPDWHPEGDVWIHSLYCMDAFADERVGDDREDLVVGFAVLCHDFGKPLTTIVEDGQIRSIGHVVEGEAPTRSFLSRITNMKKLPDEVVPLVVNHLRPQELYKAKAGDSAVRRLAKKVVRIDRLVRVARADMQGRKKRPFDDYPAGDWLLKRAHELKVKDTAPEPIVKGRHLIELGLNPGEHFKKILDGCYNAQLEGVISTIEEGIEFVRGIIGEDSQA